KDLHARAGRPNLLIKIPGTKEGLPAIEEAIFAGVPVNVTLLFSREHYLAAAEAFLRGIERRIDAGLRPDVGSVASVFISRWDAAVVGAPLTVNTMPEGTLKALADHGELGAMLPADGGDCEEVLAQFATAGIDVDALSAQLQDEGAKSFVKSWNELMGVITSKSAALKKAS